MHRFRNLLESAPKAMAMPWLCHDFNRSLEPNTHCEATLDSWSEEVTGVRDALQE